MGSEYQIRHELAAFFGNVLHESDELKASREYLMCADNIELGGEVYCKPCDIAGFDWEAFKCTGESLASEGRPFNGYCQSNLLPPDGCECDDVYELQQSSGNNDTLLAGYVKANQVYFGRGSIQISWNYNYIKASVALTGAPQTFCQRPDLVATKEEYAWGAGLFYWMENVKNDRTCHQAVLMNNDFGMTLDIINGGLECPADDSGWHGKAVQLRLNRYCRAATALGLDTLLSFDGCIDMDKKFVQCLENGNCESCKVWQGKIKISNSTSGDNAPTKKQKTQRPTTKPGILPTFEPTITTVAEETDEMRGPCIGEPCPSLTGIDEEFCRSSNGICGTGPPYCNSDSTWTSFCPQTKTSPPSTSTPKTPPPSTTKPPSTSIPTTNAIPATPSLSTSRTKHPTLKPTASESMTISTNQQPTISPIPPEELGFMTNWAMTELKYPPTQTPSFYPTHLASTKPTPLAAPKPTNTDQANESEADSREPVTAPVFETINQQNGVEETSSSFVSKVDEKTFIFRPLDDTTLSRAHPDTNYGSEPSMVVDMIDGDVALISFDLSDLGGSKLEKAVLRLAILDENAQISGIFYVQPTINGWTEDTVTYNSAPNAGGTLFASTVDQQDGTHVELDVTNAVWNRVVSLKVIGSDKVRSEFGSKESSYIPELVVTLASNITSSRPVNDFDSGKENPYDLSQMYQSKPSGSQIGGVGGGGGGVGGGGGGPETGRIHGHIWLDINNDGVKEADEPGLRGILVDLYSCDDKWVEGIRTSSSGDYIFDELLEGKYYTVVTVGADYEFTSKHEGPDESKDSDVDSTTGRSACIDLSPQELSASVDVGIVKSVLVSADANQSGPADIYNCRGKPCSEGEGYCRSEHNYCGTGDTYCNEKSQWTSDCPSVAPTLQPTSTGQPTFVLDDKNCSGEHCTEGDGTWCRSELGLCGNGKFYCNADAIWLPQCDGALSAGINNKTQTLADVLEDFNSVGENMTVQQPSNAPANSDMAEFSTFALPTLSQIDHPKQFDATTPGNTYGIETVHYESSVHNDTLMNEAKNVVIINDNTANYDQSWFADFGGTDAVRYSGTKLSVWSTKSQVVVAAVSVVSYYLT
jgi:hypothetical protein